MAFRHTTSKPEQRYIVVDDTIYTWAVLDRKSGEKVRKELGDPMQARLIADELNEQDSQES